MIELLVVIAAIAVLAGLLLPTLSGAREAGRAAACLSNLRHMASVCFAYADENRGVGPAIGRPYTEHPNWAFVVQQAAGLAGTAPEEVYTRRSVLVCATVDAAYPEDMTRTYAMNGTGHAGAAGDPDSYDPPLSGALPPGHIRLERGVGVPRPSETPILMDSAATVLASNPAPPTRTASVLDFRQPSHVSGRLGWFHGRAREGATGARFQAAMFDGSARGSDRVPGFWAEPLP